MVAVNVFVIKEILGLDTKHSNKTKKKHNEAIFT